MAPGSPPDSQVAECFERCFGKEANIVCRGGAAEPFYQPATATAPAVLAYRQDYASSVLHEASHWCLAGARRRELPDFGFHYEPPPRCLIGQVRFLKQEVRAQALESLFAGAAGVPFSCSYDDVEDLYPQLRPGFAAAVAGTRRQFARAGLPKQAQRYYTALLALRRPTQLPLLDHSDTTCSGT